jgi:hypothetical protein
MVFDVKYDLKHKVRLVAGGNWTVNDKEYFHSGVVRMDIGNVFLCGKTKEKVYIAAGPEFGANLHGKT